MSNYTYTILKLVSGEEIITCSLYDTPSDNIIVAQYPLRLAMTQQGIQFVPFLSGADVDPVMFDMAHVICQAHPTAELAKAYHDIVEQMKNAVSGIEVPQKNIIL